MAVFKVTYKDEIEADTLEEAYDKLRVLLAHDVEYGDVEAFEFKEIKFSDSELGKLLAREREIKE